MPIKTAAASRNPLPGRPREFDADYALRAAVGVFWQKGYHSTSIDDLCKATGVLRGSLYAAFGDKRGLFLAALDQYIDTELARVTESVLRKKLTRASLRAALLHYARMSVPAAADRGCLASNSALELIPADPEVAARVERMFRRIAATLEAALGRGQAAGLFRGDIDAHAYANCLLAMIQGLHVLKRVIKDEKALASIVDTMLETL